MSDEDDYMSMVIEEPKQKETFTQKKRREQREVGPLSIQPSASNPARFDRELVISKELVLTVLLQSRPKPVVESPLKQNAPRKKPSAEMKLWQPALSTPPTRVSR
jgi:hypothetical protein